MNKLAFLLFTAILFSCNSSTQQHDEHEGHNEDTTASTETKEAPLSPRTASMSNVGENHIHIDYGSPSKRGRVIFGGLVGYGQVWATGAHKATFINFSKDVVVGGVDIPSGKYGLFTIPGEESWVIIINKDWDMHLADDYNEANDIVRVEVPVQHLDNVEESLKFEVVETEPGQGVVKIKWDQVEVAFEVANSNS